MSKFRHISCDYCMQNKTETNCMNKKSDVLCFEFFDGFYSILTYTRTSKYNETHI